MNARRFAALGLVLLGGMAAVPAAPAATPGPAIARWALFEGTLTHPAPPADALRGVELRTEFTAPDGQVTRSWGFYDGGETWRFRFSPDQVGRWRYAARFSDGAAEVSGEFACTTSDVPGPLTRWRENPTWFATAAGGPVVVRSFHVGDRFFAENLEAATRTRFLDWAQAQGYNLLSIASHYLNRNAPGRGQGWRTPQLWDADARSVRPGEYAKAEAILDELRARHFYVHPSTGYGGTLDPAERHSERHAAVKSAWDFFARVPFGRLRPTWDVVKRGVCLADEGHEYWVYLAQGGATELASALPAGWRGEWLSPEGHVAPGPVPAEGQRSFPAPAAFTKDVVLHLWRE